MIIIQLFTFLLCINTCSGVPHTVYRAAGVTITNAPPVTIGGSMLTFTCNGDNEVRTSTCGSSEWSPDPETFAVLPVLINKGLKYAFFYGPQSPVVLLLHHPEAVWTSVVGHHPSHWVHRSSTAVTMDCSPLM